MSSHAFVFSALVLLAAPITLHHRHGRHHGHGRHDHQHHHGGGTAPLSQPESPLERLAR